MGYSHSLYGSPEKESGLDEELDGETFIDTRNYNASVEEDEYVGMLLDRELSSGLERDGTYGFSNWIKCARLQAIAWILKARAVFGFRFETAYLSIIYFDRFLSRRFINTDKMWAIRLLSMACLSLAAKMEECEVPLLSDFPMEELQFGTKVIQRMELSVLNSLEWRMASITPFVFLPRFIAKLCRGSPPRGFISRAIQLILGITKEINLIDHRPSAIAAAAAIMVFFDNPSTRKELESRVNSIFSENHVVDTDDVYTCYRLMQSIEMNELKESSFVNSPDLSSGQLEQLNGVLKNSSVASAICNKRKRLAIKDNDQNVGGTRKKRGC